MNKLKRAGIFLFFIVFLFNVSCSSEKESNSFLPKEYRFPIDQIGDGKTFVFRKVGFPDQISMKDVEIVKESGNEFLISKQYSKDAVFDSSKRTIDGKLIESLTYMMGNSKPVKGIIQEDKIIKNGSRYGQKVFKVKYEYAGRNAIINSTEEFLKDTILAYQGEMLSCVVTKLNSTIQFWEEKNPNSKQKILYSGKSFFAKGNGMIRYTSKTEDDFSTWELLEIKNQ
jgi:hypothetical protein